MTARRSTTNAVDPYGPYFTQLIAADELWADQLIRAAALACVIADELLARCGPHMDERIRYAKAATVIHTALEMKLKKRFPHLSRYSIGDLKYALYKRASNFRDDLEGRGDDWVAWVPNRPD